MGSFELSVIDKHSDDSDDEDNWLKRSIERSERSDPDFQCYDEAELILNVPNKHNFRDDRTLLVYESQLKILLARCLNCGAVVINQREMKEDGSQYRVRLECLQGCESTWHSQPVLSSVAG